MTIKRTVLLALVMILAIGTGIYYGYPQVLKSPLIELNRASAGLTEKTLRVGDHEIHYLEGGQGETLVLLHGIFAEKDHWVDFARELSGRYHLVIPDLPGYGESTRLPEGNYDYAHQVARLKAFVEGLELGPVHLAGNSMGGTISALYTIDYPQDVLTLAFIGAPHGIQSAEPSDMDRMIDADQVGLIAHTPEEFDAMMDLLFVKRPFIPYPVFADAQASAIRLAEDNKRLFLQQVKNRYLLQSQLPLITRPTLAIWGEQDRIFNITGTRVLKEDLPEALVVEMKDVGHLPQMEAPKASALLYGDFLGTQRGI